MHDAADQDLVPVRMADGLLHCPHCDSYDLDVESPGILVCEDCGKRCSRFDDQCPECGEREVTIAEVVGMRAPGQAPSQAPRRLVKTCAACGWTNA